MVGNKGGKPQSSSAAAATPRTLNVQKFAESRASELQALHTIVSSRLNNDFRSQRNKRKRTTGHHNRRIRKKQKSGGDIIGPPEEYEEKKKKKNVPRRVRRRIELKKNPPSGFSTSGDGTKRLRTHVWHAKRFTMTKRWGFHIPLGLQGRGRGSRALLKKLKHGVLVHDASYYGVVQLEGPEDLLGSILSMVLSPYPSANCDHASQNILSGVMYGSAMLHHVGTLFSQAVAPVTYMWRQQHTNSGAKTPNADTCGWQQTVDNCASLRLLWVWIHPAAFREGCEILMSVCEKMSTIEHPVNCISLEDRLGKLELIGVGAFELIQKILHPATCISENSWALRKHSVADVDDGTLIKSSNFLKNEDEVSTSAIIPLTVNDPRSFVANGIAAVSEVKPHRILGSGETEIQGQTTLSGISESNPESVSSLCSKPEESFHFKVVDLWDASKGIIAPVAENVLCKEKHEQRMDFFCLNNKSLGSLDASEEGQSSQLCPIMLLKSNVVRNSITRLSIILPLSWAKAFWITIVSNGAQAIGLREKHWIACEVGLPYFPSDFPDTSAYSCIMAMEAAIAYEKVQLCPPAMRPLRVPTLPPWNCLRCALEKRLITAGDTQIGSVIDDSTEILDCEKPIIAVVGSHGTSFDGFVARTSHMLIHFLAQINGDHLLLFPHIPDGKKSLLKVLKDEEMLDLPTKRISSQIKCYGKLCFLRVLLHAFKEGVFEEGAVVCAPHASDITMWRSRSEVDGVKLQVPQSLRDSYFVHQPSGEWELQVPEDPEIREYFRWPIGFVTTGFIRGSKNPVAVALCEAVLLARVREEQWKTISLRQRKKEVYVLVRNLRSTAYRLALATIVLESQEDVEYM